MFLPRRLPPKNLPFLISSALLVASCATKPGSPSSTPETSASAPAGGAPVGKGTPRLVVLFTSDLHGQLRGHPKQGGGYARMKTFIQREKQAAEGTRTDVVAILGGDSAGKSAFPCRKSKELECFPLLKEVGFDYSTIGNGELKRPVEELNGLLRASGLQWIGTNVSSTRRGANAAWQPTLRLKGPRSGLEVMLAGWSTAPSPGEVDFSKVGYAVAAKVTPMHWLQWKRVFGETPVVWVTHQTFEEDWDLLANSCKNLSERTLALLKAHTHTHREDRSQCAPLFEPGAFGQYMSRLVFERDGNGPLKLVSHEFVPMNASVAEDSDLRSRVDSLYSRLSPEADEIVAQVAAPLDTERTGEWVAAALKKTSSADVAVVNMGAIKAGIDEGPLTREALLTSIPYNSQIMGADMGAAELSKAVCAASQRVKNGFDDNGSELVFAGAKLVSPGTPDCRLELPHRARVKIVMDDYMVKRSGRWLGVDLSSRAFKFGMDTEQSLIQALRLGGKRL